MMDSNMMDNISVIDFSAYGLDRNEPDPDRIKQLVDDVYQSLTTIGFMYLKNFGIPDQKVQNAFSVSQKFFHLPLEEKIRYAKTEDGVHGYGQMEIECLNSDIPFHDLKESFKYYPGISDQPLSGKDVPELQNPLKDFFNAMVPLHNRILEVIAMGLKLEDPKYFVDRHRHIGTDKSFTNLHSFYYPGLTNIVAKEDQIRCGEHSDFGGITLLFQDAQSGLEVRNLHGKWIPATPLEGTVVVNIGDLMQRWTSDKLIACKHRVIIPVDQILRQQARQSLVFFGNPDNSAVIECIDKSNKYPPIETQAYMGMKYAALYS